MYNIVLSSLFSLIHQAQVLVEGWQVEATLVSVLLQTEPLDFEETLWHSLVYKGVEKEYLYTY